MRKWIGLTGFLACVVLFASYQFFTVVAQQRPVSDVVVREYPITIAMSTVGDFAEGSSWYLSVNAANKASLTIESYPHDLRREFTITAEQMTKLRQALVDNRFFELADEYGGRVPCGSTDTITITVGHRTKSVQLHFLMGLKGDKEKLEEPIRAINVAMILRSWFDDAEAVDLRKYDQMLIDSVK